MHIDTETHYYTYAAAERAVRELLSQFEGDYNYETLAAEVLVTGNNGARQYWAITSAADTASAREIQEVLDRHRIRFTPLGIDFTAAWPTFDAAITQGILPVLAQFEGTFDVDAIAAEVLREDRSGHIRFIPGAAEATREQIQDVLDRHRLDAAPSVEAPPSVEAQADAFEREFMSSEESSSGRIRTIRELRQLVDRLHEQVRERDAIIRGLTSNTSDARDFRRRVVVTVLGYAAAYGVPEVGEQVLNDLSLTTAEVAAEVGW